MKFAVMKFAVMKFENPLYIACKNDKMLVWPCTLSDHLAKTLFIVREYFLFYKFNMTELIFIVP